MDALFQFIPLIFIIITITIIVKLRNKGREAKLKEINKEHNKHFKTYDEAQDYLKIKLEKEIEEERKISAEKKRLEKEQQKEERITASEPSEASLTGKIARLQKLYNSGTLSKAEFEKAKNNLLK